MECSKHKNTGNHMVVKIKSCTVSCIYHFNNFPSFFLKGMCIAHINSATCAKFMKINHIGKFCTNTGIFCGIYLDI